MFPCRFPHTTENLGFVRETKWDRGTRSTCAPPTSCAWILPCILPTDLFGYTMCLSLGRETTCELMMHQQRAGAVAGSFFCIAGSVLAVLVGTTSQLRRPRCGRRGVKGALEHPAPETRQSWIPKGEHKAGLQV